MNWTRGDRLIVETLDDIMVLMRCSSSWTEDLAGRLTHVLDSHEETLEWMEEERRRWGDASRDDGGGRYGQSRISASPMPWSSPRACLPGARPS